MDIDASGLSFPLRLGAGRSLAVVELEADVRAMIEQILLTAPGERVNRPTFGVGIYAYVFEADSPFLAARLRTALEDNCYEHLGRNVRIVALEVTPADEQLLVDIEFEITGTVSGRQSMTVQVPREGTP
ncbi:MAG TPA: GPW/gp25 family protein [Kofleriaceae bacterium]|nr:GPW/gp25 family protein [Kofleriaceae bacterium]